MLIDDDIPEKSNLNLEKPIFQVILPVDANIPLYIDFSPRNDYEDGVFLPDLNNFTVVDKDYHKTSNYSDLFLSEYELLSKKSDRFSDSPVYLNKMASIARRLGKYDLERFYIQKAMYLVENDYFFNKYGESLILSGELNSAERHFKSRDFSENFGANLRLAYFDVLKGSYATAKKYIIRSILIQPNDYSSYLFLGILELITKEPNSAIRCFRLASELRPSSSIAHLNIGVAYLGIGNREKAFNSLKLAVSLDPLNSKALVLLVDVAVSIKKSDQVISFLKYYLSIKDEDVLVHERLAQTYFELGDCHSALYTLKNLKRVVGSDPVRVWNNIGVAYHRMGIKHRNDAFKSFKNAISNGICNNRDSLIAARNVCIMLADVKEYHTLLGLTKELLTYDVQSELISDVQFSDFYVFHLLGLANLKKFDDAVVFAENILSIERAHDALKIWVASWLISHYALEGHKHAIKLADAFCDILPVIDKQIGYERMSTLINSIVFAYVEADCTNKAIKLLPKLSNYVHKISYPTATLGLFHLRNGNIERGKELYNESIRLADYDVKDKIRQKLNYELAKYWFSQGDVRNAIKYIEKAIETKGGVPQIESAVKKFNAKIIKAIRAP